MFGDHFLQIATYLPSKNIYGFGENTHESLRHDLNYKTWPLFARGYPPGDVSIIFKSNIDSVRNKLRLNSIISGTLCLSLNSFIQ